MESSTKEFQQVSQEALLQSIEQMVAGAGISPEQFMPAFHRHVKRTSDPRRALNNFHRFLSAGFSNSLLRDFHGNNILVHIIVDIFGQSQYLADILVRNPEWFYWLVSTDALKVSKTQSQFLTEAKEAIQPFERIEKKIGALKRFHRRETLRVGARDVLREAPMMVITKELSNLADSIIACVLTVGIEDMKRNSGIEAGDSLAVIGLGKLGGNELNFSSDIDLMFVYDKDEELASTQTRIKSTFEYYNRLAEFVVRRLSEHIDEGHLYRVDMRLRPDGGAGPLAMSRQGYHMYYESRGELWERQMLLKSRIVAGNRPVGESWLKDLEPFIYPKTMLVSPLHAISEIKKKIEAKGGANSNIKLGVGGIRDIEFIVQALQLLNGGSNDKLRNQNTMEALAQLSQNSLLRSKETKALGEAYEFLRNVEHRLQLLHGRQTHSLPMTHDEMQKLSQSLGFKIERGFRRTLEGHRRRVRSIFKSVFESSGVKEKEKQRASRSLEKLKYADKVNALRNLALLRENLAEVFEPGHEQSLIGFLKRYRAVDWALKNFLRLSSVESIKRSLSQSIQNHRLLELLIHVAAGSSRLTEILAGEPVLFESLVAAPERVMETGIGWEYLLREDSKRFRLFNEFKIGTNLLVHQLTVREMTLKLSNLADAIVVHEFERFYDNRGVCLVALGKLGGQEITFGSDLDLICVYDDPKMKSTVERSSRDFLKFFESSGVYELDFRLRPEGKSSPLATQIGYYDTYLERRASLWEKQSLLKARIVCGDALLGDRILTMVQRQMHLLPVKRSAKELLRMRKKMEKERAKTDARDLKLSKGGIMDLEFALQAIQLRFGAQYDGLRNSNSFGAIDGIAEAGIMNKARLTKLRFNYTYLRKLETFIRLNSISPASVLPDDDMRLMAISTATGEKSVGALRRRLAVIRTENRNLLLRALDLCSK